MDTTFKIKDGYFDFIIIEDIHWQKTRRRCFKCKKLKTALNMMLKVLQKGGIEWIDYEVEILNKKKGSTGKFIDIHNVDHPIKEYVI